MRWYGSSNLPASTINKTMKIIKSLGTYIKEQSNTPNLTFRLHAICKDKGIRPCKLKTTEDVWSILYGYGFSHDYLLTLSRELLRAESGFETQDFDPTAEF